MMNGDRGVELTQAGGERNPTTGEWWDNDGAAQEQWSSDDGLPSTISPPAPSQPQSQPAVIQMTMDELDRRIAQGAERLMKEMLKQLPIPIQNDSALENEGEPEIEYSPLIVQEGATRKSRRDTLVEVKNEAAAPSKLRLGISHTALIKEKEKEEEEDEWHTPFGESTYTLLYMCPFPSQAFFYAIFVYFIQMITITLTLVDIVDAPGTSDNPLRTPPMVDLTVTIAQVVAIILALAYQSDLIEAVLKLQEGFYPEVTVSYPGATFPTWLFSCMAQMGAGLLLLITIFVLTMQVADVLSIMLNFAALHFMAEIDDLGFSLAKLGFITDHLQVEVNQVCDFEIPKRKVSNIWRRILYFMTLMGLLLAYAIIKRRQLTGLYLSTYIYVQFGDAYNEKIPYYSGLMKSVAQRTSGHRQYRDVATGGLLLAFCDGDRVWTFSDSGDKCNYTARSKETKSYDVTNIPDVEWEVRDSYNRFQPFETFSLVNRDCDPEICQGTCVHGLCHCKNDQFGLDCQFSNVCPDFDIHGKFDPFPYATLDHWAISDEFQLLKNTTSGEYVRVQNMPVYYSQKTYPANIIFFGGRRWILTSEWDLIVPNLTEVRKEFPYRVYFPEKTVQVLENNFHGYYHAKYTPFFLSDPVDFETEHFLPTPGGLGWWTVRIVDQKSRHYEPDSPLNTFLTCKTCVEKHGGFCDSVGGTCNHTSGACECKTGYFGNTCELQKECYDSDGVQCGGHGVCDENSGFCRCHLPYYGKLCEVKYFCYEEKGTCRNSGKCNLESTECECGEDPAVTGVACEEFRNCVDAGCSNGGLCRPTGKCECRPPFYGYLCDLVDTSKKEFFCSSNADCRNGVCNRSTGICDCAEGSGSYGTLCEHQYNCTASKRIKCLNSGLCDSLSGLCDCKEPFFGPDCSGVPDCMFDSDCVYDGRQDAVLPTCDILTGRCRNCESHREGKLCEKTTDCNSVGCFNGGECGADGFCTCTPPSTGPNCDYVLTDDIGLEEVRDSQFQKFFDECGFPPFPANTSGSCL